mgnify:FL=1
MGIGDALDIYDHIKDYQEEKEHQAWLAEQNRAEAIAVNSCCAVLFVILFIVGIISIILAVRANKKKKLQTETQKLAGNVQHTIPNGNPYAGGQYTLQTVGTLKVKSIVKASSYREIVCNFVNNDISLEFNLTDVGEYSWLNEGDEVKVHLAKDQFKYYVSRCTV